MRKKTIILIFIATIVSISKLSAQFSSVSFNTLGYVSGNINVALDFKVNNRLTFNLPISISPVKFNSLGWRNATIEPGFRMWVNNIYHGSFVGVYAVGSYFNFLFDSTNHKGWAAGAGASYGYSFFLTKRWNLDVELGLAVVYADYNTNPNIVYGPFDDEQWSRFQNIMLVPSRARVSFSYLF